MSELDKITTEVPPSSLTLPKTPDIKNIEDVYTDLINIFKLNLEENSKFSQGISTEKFNRTLLHRMLLELVITIIDESKKPNSNDKADDALYQQNKKIAKDLAFGLFNTLNSFNYNDKLLKLNLLGKVIQSLHGSRY